MTSTFTRSKLRRGREQLNGAGMQDDREPGSLVYAANVVPGRSGLRIRRGAELRATLSDEVTALFSYTDGTLFGADDGGDVYDITSPASTTVTPSPSIKGSVGSWHAIEFSTSAGYYIIATTDGDDEVWIYNGTLWQPLAAAAPSYIPVNLATLSGFPAQWVPGQTVTGGTSGATGTLVGISASGVWVHTVAGSYAAGGETLTTTAGGTVTSTGADVAGPGAWTLTGLTSGGTSVSRPWVHGERLWYVEPGALAAWYMPVAGFAGAATRFPLAGVFRKGGTLLVGGEVSSDSGSGMQSRCVFITTRGEVAIYEGLDPATWSLVGLYQIAPPLGPNAVVKYGGDLSVVTEDGLTSVLTSVFSPRGSREATELMTPIRDYWQAIADNYGTYTNWRAEWWPREGYYIIAPPPQTVATTDVLIVTADGAWATFTGWPVTALHRHVNGLVFGTPDGSVANAEVTGQDLGAAYKSYFGIVMGSLPATKLQLRRGRVVTLARQDPYAQPWALAGLDVNTTPSGGVAAGGALATGAWGSAVWGTDVWGGGGGTNWQTYGDWKGLSTRGHECIIGGAVLTNSEGAPDAVMTYLDWIAEIGDEPW